MFDPYCSPLPLTDLMDQAAEWWRGARMWTLMYRSLLLAVAGSLVAFVVARIIDSRRERARLAALVASRTRQLRLSEEQFRSIFEHAIEGLYQSSLDGHNLRANPAMARLCGYRDPEEMRTLLVNVGRQFYVDPERRQEIQQELTQNKVITNLESEVRRKDGSTFWASESVRLVVDPATGQSVYQGSLVDITTRKALQEAREQARAAAEDANRAKSAFLTQITHELRTPLTGILGGARVALRDPRLDTKNHERFSLIVTSGEHLLGLIDELLDLSRIESGRFELRVAPFALDELLRSLCGEFRLRAGDARTGFRLEADPTLPRRVLGDAGRLRQVLVNLLGNAVKFTARGEVALRVRSVVDGAICFEVADTGIGIPAEELTAIFQPFHQVPSHRGQTVGAGLGLNISARLVECMGGRLEVASELGQGSRFWFAVPLPVAEGGGTLEHVRDSVDSATLPAAMENLGPLPPAPEIAALLNLALAGDIVRLRERLAGLREQLSGGGAFAARLERMAAGFRMDEITQLLQEAWREQTGDPDALDHSTTS